MPNFSDSFRVGLFEENILPANIQDKTRPWAWMILTQSFGNLAEFLKRDFMVIPQYRNHAKTNDILKRVDAAKGAAPIF